MYLITDRPSILQYHSVLCDIRMFIYLHESSLKKKLISFKTGKMTGSLTMYKVVSRAY